MTTFDTIYNSMSTFVLKYLNFDNLFFILIGMVAFSLLVGVIFGKRTLTRRQRKHDDTFIKEIWKDLDEQITNPAYSFLPGNVFHHDK